MWRYALSLCLLHGVESAPRGNLVYEVPWPVTLQLTDVHKPFILDPIRRVNYRFGFAEAAWILAGSDDVKVISDYNKVMAQFSDDGKVLWGAYGPRLMGQINHVVATLQRDPDSRQAIVTTWRPQVGPFNGYPHPHEGQDDYPTLKSAGVVSSNDPQQPEWDGNSWRSKDIPCTVAWHFTIRNGKLNLTVFMRSHDVWLGMPYDVLSFTTVQRVVASMLELEPGVYNHVLSNLHLYGTNFDDADAIYSRRINIPEVLVPELPSFKSIFHADTTRRLKNVWQMILTGDCPYGNDGLKPFIGAINRDRHLWPEYDRLMKANLR